MVTLKHKVTVQDAGLILQSQWPNSTRQQTLVSTGKKQQLTPLSNNE